jgi:hypothetical protein
MHSLTYVTLISLGVLGRQIGQWAVNHTLELQGAQ